MLHVLMQVDGDEQTPIGAYADIETARAAALEWDHQFDDRDEGPEAAEETTRNFNANWDASAPEDVRTRSSIDVQWQSGVISLDYRIFSVEVR
jgi:hypothetical protein